MAASKESSPEGSHQVLAMGVLKQFRIIYGSVKQQFRQIEESCGISGSQLWLLQEISRKPDCGVSELALRLAIHQSTCSLLVDKLERSGLLIKKRSKDDQRRVGLTLTETAEKLLKGAPGPAEGLLPQALQAMPEEALQTLSVSLSELIQQLSARDERHAARPLADL